MAEIYHEKKEIEAAVLELLLLTNKAKKLLIIGNVLFYRKRKIASTCSKSSDVR